MTFIFCTAAPAAPLTRLSSAEKITTLPRLLSTSTPIWQKFELAVDMFELLAATRADPFDTH